MEDAIGEIENLRSTGETYFDESDGITYYSNSEFSMVPMHWLDYRPQFTEIKDENKFIIDYDYGVCQKNISMCDGWCGQDEWD